MTPAPHLNKQTNDATEPSKRGCPSLVLAGGMKAMLMTVMFFTYTGSGGTDLSGNKSTTNQSSDQKLERTSSPSGQKHSKHAMRGSAIFKVVKCYLEKGPSGLIVWRYLLRRQGCRFACSLDRGGQEKDGRRRVPLWFLKQARVGKI